MFRIRPVSPTLARGLVELGYSILSTGGTAKLLQKEGIPCREVADYTGFPEMLDGAREDA